MDRFGWAVALVALALFVGIVVGAAVMTTPSETPRVSCAGSATCKPAPQPTFDEDPIPPARPTESARY